MNYITKYTVDVYVIDYDTMLEDYEQMMREQYVEAMTEELDAWETEEDSDDFIDFSEPSLAKLFAPYNDVIYLPGPTVQSEAVDLMREQAEALIEPLTEEEFNVVNQPKPGSITMVNPVGAPLGGGVFNHWRWPYGGNFS